MADSNKAAVQLALSIYNAMPLPARRRTSLENVIDTVQTMFALNMGITREHIALPQANSATWDGVRAI